MRRANEGSRVMEERVQVRLGLFRDARDALPEGHPERIACEQIIDTAKAMANPFRLSPDELQRALLSSTSTTTLFQLDNMIAALVKHKAPDAVLSKWRSVRNNFSFEEALPSDVVDE